MEPRPHTPPPPPPPPPIQQMINKVNCGWCNQPMESTAIRCTSCGKIRKDIYNNKVAGYILSFIAMIFVLIGLFTEGTTSIVFSVIGLLFAAGSFYFYSKVSKLLKSWWWV